MKNILVSLWISLALTAYVKAQDTVNTVSTNELAAKERFYKMIFTTPAYKREALKLLLEEANRLAQELDLPEQLPIVKSNLVDSHIPSPQSAREMKAIGSVATSNYFYSVYSGDRFAVGRTHLEEEAAPLREQYLWPASRMDTNAAYQLATQWLTAIAVDVKGLNHDFLLKIRTCNPEGPHGSHFVPIYWVGWYKKLDHAPDIVEYASKAQEEEAKWKHIASVELLLPTKTLHQLYVDDPKYILRKPVVVTNIAYLLSQTNEMIEEANRLKEEAKRIRASQKEYFYHLMSTNDVLGKAVQAMVAEANRLAEALHLPEQLPITATNLEEIHVESPKTADDKAVAGCLVTSDYKYDFSATNGFGVYRISDAHLPYDKYHWSLNQINTNAAYQLATQWLAAASIDVNGLNRDYKMSVAPEHVVPDPGDNRFKDYYMPFYFITWYKGSASAPQMGAHVQMFLPTKTLHRMIVQDTKYILRKPLEITNLDYLLSQTSAPASTNVPISQ